MLFKSLLVLAVAAPLVVGTLGDNALGRRTGDDDLKDKDLSSTAIPAPSFASLPTFDGIPTKDKPLLPGSLSSSNTSKTPVVLVKPVLTSDLTTLSVSTSPAAKDDKGPGSSAKDKDISNSLDTDVFIIRTTSFSKDSSTSKLLTLLPAKDYTTVSISVSKDDKTTSKDDKSIDSYASKDDKTLNLRTSSSSSDRKFLTSLAIASDKSGKLSKDKTAQPVEIVYSVTVPVAPSITSESPVGLAGPSQSRLTRTALATLTQAADLASSSLTLVSVGNGSASEFYGYQIVPSPTQTVSQGVEHYSASVTPVYIPAMLGNAYGGGFVATPSIYVSKRPYPNGPSEGVPPGYGSYSSLETQLNVSNAFLAFTTEKDTTPSVGILRPTQLPKDKVSTSSPVASFTIYYITEEVLTTTTYCPLTTISGKVITLKSTTLTSTFSTRSVVTQTQAVTRSTALSSGSTVLRGVSSLRSKTTGLFETTVTVSRAPFVNSTFTINSESKQVFPPKLEASGSSFNLASLGNIIETTSSRKVPIESKQAKSAAPFVPAQSLASLSGNLSGATIIGDEGKLPQSTAPNQAGIEVTKPTASITRGSQVLASSILPSSVPELLSLLGSSRPSIPTNGTLVASLVSKLSVLLGSAITSKPTKAVNTASLGPDTTLPPDSEISSLLSSLGGSISKGSINSTFLGTELSSLLGTLLASIPSSEVSAISPSPETPSLLALSGVSVPTGVAVGVSSVLSGTTTAFAIASLVSELSALLVSSSIPTGRNASILAPLAPLASDVSSGNALGTVASGSSQMNRIPTESGTALIASIGASKNEAATESTISASIVVGPLASSEASQSAATTSPAIAAETVGGASNSPEIQISTIGISNVIQQASSSVTSITTATLNEINFESETTTSTSFLRGVTSPGIGSATLPTEAKGASISQDEVLLGPIQTASGASDEAEGATSVSGISSATETALELVRPEGGRTSTIQGGALSSSSLVLAFESVEGGRASLSSSLISVLAGQPSHTAAFEGGSRSAAAGLSSPLIAQITSPAGANLFTGTHTILSTSGAIDVAGRGNDSVSVILHPTAVSPFLGAATRHYQSFGLGLVGSLAIFLML